MLLQWMIFPARTRCQTDADQRVERASRCDAVAALATSAGYARPASTSCNAVRSAIAPACKPQQNSTHAPPGDGSAYARRLSQPLAPMSHTKTSTLALALLVAWQAANAKRKPAAGRKNRDLGTCSDSGRETCFRHRRTGCSYQRVPEPGRFRQWPLEKANPIPADRTSWGSPTCSWRTA